MQTGTAAIHLAGDSLHAAAQRPLSLRANFLWTLAGNFAYGACQWAMVIVIAKLGTPEAVGRFAFAFAVTAPAVMFANMNLRGILAADAARTYEFGDYLSVRLAMLAVVLVGVGAWALMASDRETALVTGLVAVAKAFESLSDLYFGYMQQHERMDRISRSLMLKGISSLAVLTAGVWFLHSLALGVLGLACTWALVFFLYDIRAAARISRARSLRPRWNAAIGMRVIKLAFPLAVSAVLVSLQANVPRYFVESRLGPRELGYFAGMAYLMIVGARVVTALGESANPRLAAYHAARNARGFRALLSTNLVVGVALGVGGLALALLFGRTVLTLLYKPEYATQSAAFDLLMFAAGIGYLASFLEYALTASHSFKLQPVVLAAAVAVSTAGCAMWVRDRGLLGAAMAMAVAAAVQLAGNAAALWRSRRLARA